VNSLSTCLSEEEAGLLLTVPAECYSTVSNPRGLATSKTSHSVSSIGWLNKWELKFYSNISGRVWRGWKFFLPSPSLVERGRKHVTY